MWFAAPPASMRHAHGERRSWGARCADSNKTKLPQPQRASSRPGHLGQQHCLSGRATQAPYAPKSFPKKCFGVSIIRIRVVNARAG
jgi:hypothetical protein